MFRNYHPDRVALERDPNLTNFTFDPGNHRSAYETEGGQRIHDLAVSRLGVALLIGSVVSAPSKPPVVALEPLLASQIGEDAFTDPKKQLTGRIVRYVIEHIGGQFEGRGVKVTGKTSRYKSGAVYSLPAEHSQGGR